LFLAKFKAYIVNIFDGIVVHIPIKSLNKEAFSTLEHEEENIGEIKRIDNRPVWI